MMKGTIILLVVIGDERGAPNIKLTILRHRLSKRGANAKNDCGEDILIAGYKKQSGIFGVV